MVTQRRLLEEEAKVLVSLIVRELVTDFGKTEVDAARYVHKANVFPSLIKNPVGLHESPHMWALSVLIANGDVATLEKYYQVH
jgi:hypothetical protein